MSTDFEWRFEDELSDEQSEEERTGQRRWRRWLPWLLAVLLVAGTAYVWWRDRQRNLARAEAQVRQVAQLEFRALAEDDVELFMSLQDPADRSWHGAQAAARETRGLPLPLQKPGLGVSTTVESARVVGDRARVAVVHTAALPQGKATFRAARFYRYTNDRRWLHTRADPDAGGHTIVFALDQVRIATFEQDADWIEPLASELAVATDRFCRLVSCRQDLPLELNLAATLEEGTAPDDATLPAPFLVGAPENAAAREAWKESLGEFLVSRLVSREITARRAGGGHEGRIERRDDAEAGASGPHSRDLELLRDFLRVARRIPTERLWDALSDPDAWPPSVSAGPTPLRQMVTDEKERMLTAEAESPPTFPDLPDLTPPPGGWIAFRTPEERLALVSPDGSRRIPLTEGDRVRTFAWSPDGNRLVFGQGSQLILFSIRDACFIPLTPPDAVDHQGQLAWSQDSRHLAYLHSLEGEGYQRVAPDALRVVDVTTREAITVSTYTNTRPEEIAFLPRQPFPFPLLGVETGGTGSPLRIRDVRHRTVLTALHGSHHLWFPDAPAIAFARAETEKPGIEWTCAEAAQSCAEGETQVIRPTSLTIWRMAESSAGDGTPTVVLEGTRQRHIYPARWLPDGRLEVRVLHFERTAYDEAPQPERVIHRYLAPTDEGMLSEVETDDLPWWAGNGFDEAFMTTGLYREQIGGPPRFTVAPDGDTVAFVWFSHIDEERSPVGIYVWDRQGEPVPIIAGWDPAWQPTVPASGER